MKHMIKRIILLSLLFVISYGVFQVVGSYVEKKDVESDIQLLPKASFVNLNNEEVSLHDYYGKPLVIIHFHPDCEHCQYEMQALRLNMEALFNTQLLLITQDDSLIRINKFIEDNHLWDLEEIDVLLDNSNAFYNSFGTSVVPSIFIYNSHRRLQKKYLGETKPEAIIASLPQ